MYRPGRRARARSRNWKDCRTSLRARAVRPSRRPNRRLAPVRRGSTRGRSHRRSDVLQVGPGWRVDRIGTSGRGSGAVSYPIRRRACSDRVRCRSCLRNTASRPSRARTQEVRAETHLARGSRLQVRSMRSEWRPFPGAVRPLEGRFVRSPPVPRRYRAQGGNTLGPACRASTKHRSRTLGRPREASLSVLRF